MAEWEAVKSLGAWAGFFFGLAMSSVTFAVMFTKHKTRTEERLSKHDEQMEKMRNDLIKTEQELIDKVESIDNKVAAFMKVFSDSVKEMSDNVNKMKLEFARSPSDFEKYFARKEVVDALEKRISGMERDLR